MTDPRHEVVDATRRILGPVGVWLRQLRDSAPADTRAAARRIEQLGYGSLWTGETIGGKDVFAEAAIVLSATDRLVFGTGIANVWARHPATMQGAAHTVAAAWPRRFVHGVGVSHSVLVTPSGQAYERPLQHLRAYVRDMDAAVASAPRVAEPVPRLLAALGPRMLAAARDQADGAHPYLVPIAHVVRARDVLGPDRLLVPELKVVLHTDAGEARRRARAYLAGYLALPNYVRNLLTLGFDDRDITGHGSDRLVDALVAWGDDAGINERVEQFRAAGADHVLIQPIAADLAGALRTLARLAPTG